MSAGSSGTSTNSGTKSQGKTPTKSQRKNPFIETDEENASIDELLESDEEDDKKTVNKHVDKKEILKVRNSSSKKNSSIFNDEHTKKYFRDKSDDDDIKVVDELSLEPLDDSYYDKITIPRCEEESDDKLKQGLLNFDRKIKGANKNDTGAKPKSILKKVSVSSTSSVELTENKEFKFPSYLKQVSKDKSSGKKQKTEAFESIPDQDEDGSKPMWMIREAETKRKRVAHVPKSKSKEIHKSRSRNQ